MTKDTQSRRILLTINNPKGHNMSHEQITEVLTQNFPSVIYFAGTDEQGETYHTHLYIVFKNGVRFSKIKRYFPAAHIDTVRGTTQETLDYITKSGKWADTEKAETAIENSFFEWGERPTENIGGSDAFSRILQMIYDGETLDDIRDKYPSEYFLYNDRIKRLQHEHQIEIQPVTRPMEVTYIFGAPNTGKSYDAHITHGKDLYCAQSFDKHMFDGYKGEAVLCLDEFTGQLPTTQMNAILDVYPLSLPARYSNKTGLYEKVLIISNLDLRLLYLREQQEAPALWQAFLRRIHKVIHYEARGEKHEYTRQEFFAKVLIALPQDYKTPFDKEIL
jgi:hypothetical protein